ncbi:MAG: CPBP family intramembrane metalloprotease [Candidatus Lokiarchaeota archaeon]|nr:CPBP family intramembrane metalloprotease [Candidatus Lokiarchaeota archaeon]
MAPKENGFRNILLFFIITFVFSWAFWIPQVMNSLGIIPDSAFTDFLSSPFNIAAFGPFIAAILMVLKEDKLNGIKGLLKKGIQVNFSKKWILPIFLLFPVIFLLSMLLGLPFGFSPNLEILGHPEVVSIGFLVILLTAGPLQEEFGWRGYAVSRLQERYNALITSFIVGVAWALWHFPLFFLPHPGDGSAMYYDQPVWIMVISVIFASIIFTWIYNNTNESVFATLLLHTTLNWIMWVFLPMASFEVALISTVLIVVVALMIVFYYGPFLKKSWIKDE